MANTEVKCIVCDKWIQGIREFELHQLAEHQAYKNQQPIIKSTINTLDKNYGKVYALLLSEPSSRADHETNYNNYLLRYHSDKIGYANGKMIRPFKQRGIPSFETVRRITQKIQELAYDRIEEGKPTQEDLIVIPAERIAIRRKLREVAVRNWVRKNVN